MNWDDLRYFLAVARASGLTPAAQELGVSPATASRRVEAFEQAMGMTLFLRRQTGYTLTDDGERLLVVALPVEQAMLGFARRTQGADRPGAWAGSIRVATSEAIAVHWITPLLPEFVRGHSGLQVELVTGVSTVNLSRRDADIALRMSPPAREEEGEYIALSVGVMTFAAYVAVGDGGSREVSGRLGNTGGSDAHAGPDDSGRAGRGDQGGQGTRGDWRTLPYATWSEPMAHVPMARWAASTFAGRRPILLSNSMAVLVEAARCGLGVAVLPTSIGDRIPAITRVEPGHFACARDLWLVYHRDLRDSARVAAMKDFLVDVVGRCDVPRAQ